MKINYIEIAEHYLSKIVTSNYYLQSNPVKEIELLYPGFKALLNKLRFNFPVQFAYTETYRSNTLQKQYYSQGLSKIKTNGMHHYGIAADLIFIIDGQRTYKGPFDKLHTAYESVGGPDLGSLENWDAGHLQFIPVVEQNRLREEVNAAVLRFQRKQGLKIDGIIGPNTIAAAKKFYS
ncbi:MAG: peptidoglycan-binding protein [Ignavibacteriae bacterium]|nr:MAG: peptidoglycan-binding protein [Ignavibacteriota bacterium]